MPKSVDLNRAVTGASFNVTVSELSPDAILCLVAGEVDLLTAPALQTTLTDTIGATRSNLVIDLSAVRFLASIGLNVLVEALAALEAAGRHLAVVVGDNPVVTRALQTTGLDQVFDLHVAMATAAAACLTLTAAQQPGAC
ncbi:MAG TPA: STAS domain-containing protein [Pseudonocardiaceae bacterium]|nr:STAS domain-containing protein [Pseudonocardiaceae bacterium]